MKDKKIALLSLFVLLPLLAFADHEEVLLTFFGVTIEVIFFLVIIPVVKMKGWWKAIIILVFFTFLILGSYITHSMPYLENETKINIILMGMPLLAIALTYIALKVFTNYKKV